MNKHLNVLQKMAGLKPKK